MAIYLEAEGDSGNVKRYTCTSSPEPKPCMQIDSEYLPITTKPPISPMYLSIDYQGQSYRPMEYYMSTTNTTTMSTAQVDETYTSNWLGDGWAYDTAEVIDRNASINGAVAYMSETTRSRSYALGPENTASTKLITTEFIDEKISESVDTRYSATTQSISSTYIREVEYVTFEQTLVENYWDTCEPYILYLKNGYIPKITYTNQGVYGNFNFANMYPYNLGGMGYYSRQSVTEFNGTVVKTLSEDGIKHYAGDAEYFQPVLNTSWYSYDTNVNVDDIIQNNCAVAYTAYLFVSPNDYYDYGVANIKVADSLYSVSTKTDPTALFIGNRLSCTYVGVKGQKQIRTETRTSSYEYTTRYNYDSGTKNSREGFERGVFGEKVSVSDYPIVKILNQDNQDEAYYAVGTRFSYIYDSEFTVTDYYVTSTMVGSSSTSNTYQNYTTPETATRTTTTYTEAETTVMSEGWY